MSTAKDAITEAIGESRAMKTDGFRYFRMPYSKALETAFRGLARDTVGAVTRMTREGNEIEVGFDLSFLGVQRPDLLDLARNLTRDIPYSDGSNPVWKHVGRLTA